MLASVIKQATAKDQTWSAGEPINRLTKQPNNQTTKQPNTKQAKETKLDSQLQRSAGTKRNLRSHEKKNRKLCDHTL